jgi:hypothetical protein
MLNQRLEFGGTPADASILSREHPAGARDCFEDDLVGRVLREVIVV